MKLKKSLGQNFLRDERVLNNIIEHAALKHDEYVFEIGCGDGALSRKLITNPIKFLVIIELDKRCVERVKSELGNKKLCFYNENILDFDTTQLTKISNKWSLVANIPYCITHPILKKVVLWKNFLRQAVLMVQEEIAQKIVKKRGRDYSYLSLLMQYNFHCTLHEKVPPEAFYPAPQVNSRIIQLIPRTDAPIIHNEKLFWEFVDLIFGQPRRTIHNNIKATLYENKIPEEIKSKRAQELSLDEIINLWNHINN